MPTLGDGAATIARKSERVRFPACPAAVVASATPCPCGHRGTDRTCRCTGQTLARWEARLAETAARLGLERIEVPALTVVELTANQDTR